MADMNRVSIIGRLTRDVEEPQGQGPLRFSVAVNRSVKRGEEWADEASFLDVEYWHRSILQYLTKGKQLGIDGELKQDRWTDKETGQPRSKVVIAAQRVQLLGGGKDADHGAGGAQGSTVPPRPAKPKPEAQVRTETAADGFQDEIPF